MAFIEVAKQSRLQRVIALTVLTFRAQWYFFAIPAVYLFTNWLMLSRLDSYRHAPVMAVLMDLLSFTLPVGPFQIARYNLHVTLDSRESSSTPFVAELEVGHVSVHDTVQQFERLGRAVEVGFPHDGRQVGRFLHHTQDSR